MSPRGPWPRAGVRARLPVVWKRRPSAQTHPDAADWSARAVANGGSVSASTLTAVDSFCRDIDAAGLRDRFYRLNLFCGTGLNACLVPLYRNYRLSAGRNQVQGEVFSGWTLSAATVTGGAASAPAVAPASAPLASSFKETTTTLSPHTMTFQYTATGAACVVSAYVKPDGRDWILFSVEDAGGNPFAYAYFNLAGLATGSVFAGASSAAIADAGGGWTRVSFRCTPTAGTRFLKIFSSTANNSNQSVGDSTKGYMIWGVQLEYGTTLSEYDTYPLGNATDTNVGPFVSGDYSESTGLLAAQATSKYLNTGLAASAMPASVYQSMHLSVAHGFFPAVVTDPILIGANDTSVTERMWLQMSIRATPTASDSVRLGRATTATSLTAMSGSRNSGFLLGTRQSSTSIKFFRNGVQDGENTTSTTGITANPFPFFVFRNNSSGTPSGDWPGGTIRSYSIGDDMSNAQVASFHSALAAFNASLGRTS